MSKKNNQKQRYVSILSCLIGIYDILMLSQLVTYTTRYPKNFQDSQLWGHFEPYTWALVLRRHPWKQIAFSQYCQTAAYTAIWVIQIIYTGIPHFICDLHYCTFQILHFLPIEGLWQPSVEQVYQCHFSSSNCSLHVSLSHFDHFHSISIFFIIIIFVMVICINIFDVTMVIVLEAQQTVPC